MHPRLIARGASHLLVKRWAGPFWYRRRWLNRTQWSSEAELKQIQLGLFQQLVKHCFKTVPFYSEMMNKTGISPEDIKSLEDINRFPIISKKDVLTAGDAIISTAYPRWLMSKGRTSGTTGTPLVLHRNYFSLGNEHAFIRRQWDWAGLGFNDRAAYLTSRVVADPEKNEGPLWVYEPFMKELILSTHHLSAETAKDYLDAISRYGVSVIIGYPAAIMILAKTCSKLSIRPNLKVVFTMSETVTDDVKMTISKAFACKVFDHYGAGERVCYIHTCEHGSYHILPEYGYTELMPAASDSDICTIVSTGFWNYGTPLIRYNTGDTLIKSDLRCRCGRAFPVVKSITGRKGAVIRTRSGIEYAPTLIAMIIKDASHILESQLIQDAIDHVTVLYVPDEEFTQHDLDHLKYELVSHVSNELKLDFKQVSAVERTAAGKTNLVISRLRPDADDKTVSMEGANA